MSEEVSELIVKARPEGISETQDQLGGLEETTQESADALEGQADQMEGFARSFEGAMGAVVAGLAVASAGLLAQVPVIGQAMQGLFAIVEAVAFQMDQVLRPVLGPISDFFFSISEAVFEADGAMGDLIGIFGTVAAVAGIAQAALMKFKSTGLGAILSGSLTAAGALGGLIGLFGVAALEVSGVLDAVEGFGQFIGNNLPTIVKDGMNAVLTAGLAPLLTLGAAILGFVEGFLEGGLEEGVAQMVARVQQLLDNFVNSWDNILGTVGGTLRDWGRGLVELGGDFLDWLAQGIRMSFALSVSAMVTLGEKLMGALPSLDDLKEYGADLISSLIDGIKSKVDDLKSVMNGVAGAIDERMPSSPADTGPLSDLDKSGPGMVDTLASGIEANISQVESAANNVASAAANGNAGGGANFASRPERTSIISVDGRKVGETTSTAQRDISASRNIDG